MTTTTSVPRDYEILFDRAQWSALCDESLQQLVRPEDSSSVVKTQKNLFDPSLWAQLIAKGAIHHHRIILAQLQPGYLWVQHGLEGAILHWTKKGDSEVYRAHLFNGVVQVVTYNLVGKESLNSKSFMSLYDFREFIHQYLVDHSSTLHPVSRPTSQWVEFQKKLELFPIVIRITTAASQRLQSLQAAHLGIFFRVDPAKEHKSPLNPKAVLVQISGRFIEKLARSGGMATVSPTIHSWESFAVAETNNVDLSENDRKTRNLSLISNPLSLRIRHLYPILVLREKQKVSMFEFGQRVHDKQAGSERFELAIHYQDTQWTLGSQLFT